MAPVSKPATASRLRRILGVGFGLAVIVGSTLGVGILRAPGLVAAQLSTPQQVLVAWVVGGLYTLLAAICLVELGVMLPKAGGYYVYARQAFGNTAAFAVGWTDWLTYCAVIGYISIAIGEFAATLAPALDPWVKPFAVAVLVGFVALQWAGLRVSSRFQEWTTALKFGAFLAVVTAALALSRRVSHQTVGAVAAHPTIGGVVAALQAVVITYGGWQSALYFTEEDRDPARNLPRAMIGGVAAVIVIYVLVNLALLSTLSSPDLARSTLPAADAAQALFGGRGRDLVTLLALVSLPPTLNAVIMIGTRILFAMGRDGLLWRRMASVTPGGTPGAATIATVAVAAGLIATGTFQTLIAITAFFLAANYCVCCLALVVLRWRAPARERPFRAWAYPWSAAVVLAGAVAFLAATLAGDPATAVAAFVLMGAGVGGRAVIARAARLPQEAGEAPLA